jgi:hypothetical protein
MHLRNVFIHPTVMFRADLIAKAGFYPHQYPYAEDYALFWTMLEHTKGAIINQYMVTCALSPGGLSAANRKIQLRSCKRIISRFSTHPFWKLLGKVNTAMRLLVPQRFILKLKLLKEHYKIKRR